jgi:hypothetical protein
MKKDTIMVPIEVVMIPHILELEHSIIHLN